MMLRKVAYILLALVALTAVAGRPALRQSAQERKSRAERTDTVLSALYMSAVCQRMAGHPDAAFELLNECLRIAPDHTAALYDMANLKLAASALIDSAWVAEGDSLLRRAYRTDTANATIRERLADHLLSRGDYAGATRLYERICREPRPGYGDLGLLVQLYKIQAQYPQALATVERMEQLDEPDAMTAWERFEIYDCMGRRELAEATYDSLLVKAMPDPSTPERIKEKLKGTPRYYDKVKALRQALIATIRLSEQAVADTAVMDDTLALEADTLALESDTVIVDTVSLWTEEQEREQSQQIVKLCAEGEAFEPDFLSYYFYEALGHFSLGDTLKALDACQRGINTVQLPSDDPMAPRLYGLCGDIYTNLNNTEASVEAYETAVQMDSTDVMMLNNYAYQLSQLGRNLQRAEELSRRTLEEEPESITFLDTYAWILHCMGRDREALRYINRAVELSDVPDEELSEHQRLIREGAGKGKPPRSRKK